MGLLLTIDDLEGVVPGASNRLDKRARTQQGIVAREGTCVWFSCNRVGHSSYINGLRIEAIGCEVRDCCTRAANQNAIYGFVRMNALATAGDDGRSHRGTRSASRQSCSHCCSRIRFIEVPCSALMGYIQGLTDFQSCVVNVIHTEDRALEQFTLYAEVPLL